MKKILRTSNLRTLSTLVAVTFALPLTWMGFTGFFTWFSPFISLNSIFVLKSFVWLNFISLVILVIVWFRERWFCNNLCPVGWGCDLVSGVRLVKKSSFKRFPDIGKWLAITSLAASVTGFPLFILLDPMAIFNGFFSVLSGNIKIAAVISLAGLPVLLSIHLILPGIWCSKICPLGGLQRVVKDLNTHAGKLIHSTQIKSGETNSGRRLFIASGIGLIAGLSVPGILNQGGKVSIRPPASIDPELFNTLCVRCGSCIKACPTKIITHYTGSDNLLAWMTPEVKFEKGYCLETCNLCSKVCPSGAITHFSVEAKKEIFMGTAEINLDNCLLLNNTECDRCKIACKYEALDIVQVNQSILMKPWVITDKCVGCGACAVICPVSVIIMKPFPSEG